MRGDGRIFQRGNVFWVAYCLRGKEFREAARDKNGANALDTDTARRYLKARIREVHADEIGARTFTTPQASRLTVAELCAALKSDFELRGKFSVQTASHLRRVESDFGDRLAVALTSEQIDEYIEARLANKRGSKNEIIPGDRPASINRCLQLLGQAFNLAVRRGTLSRSPYIRKLSEADNVRTDFFTEGQLRAVIENLPEDLRDFVRFAAMCGVRKGELSAYRWDMLHSTSLRVPATICKNRKGRVLPLVGEMAEIIERQRARRRVEIDGVISMSPFIFHRAGECGRIVEFRKAWKSATRKAGCPGHLFHGLRRFAARALRDAGVPQVVAQTVTGHRTSAMWNRYALADEIDMRKALTQVEEFRKRVS